MAPFPIPLLEEMLIHVALAIAVQLQPVGAVMFTVELPPPDPNVFEVGEIEYVQPPVEPC